jgi:peptide/nickel transport system substrate-binding protein
MQCSVQVNEGNNVPHYKERRNGVMRSHRIAHRISRRDLLKLGVGASSALWLKPNSSAAAPKRGGTFTVARQMRLIEFNPLNLIGGMYPLLQAIWSTLLHYDAKLNPQPELAEAWDLSSDGKIMTFKLRRGVKFHSGREFTSEDVKHSVAFSQTDERATMRPMYQMIKQVETPDRYTVIFRFDKLYAGIFDVLDTLYIIDKETIEDRRKTAIGTGPFRVDKYIPNDRVEMVAFQDYWEKGKPYLDKYVVRDIPDVATLTINLEAGAVDCIFWLSNVDLARLKRGGGKFIADLGAPGSGKYNIGINCKVEPFTNKKVRQAIAWSIDRARFCKTYLQGLWEPSCLMWPEHSWAYFTDLEGKIGFDLDKARSLLKEAGLEKGFETEIAASNSYIPGTPELALILQADLKKIGINVRVLDLEAAAFQSRTTIKRDIVLVSSSYGRAGRDPGSMVTGARAWFTEQEAGWTHFESATYEKLRQDLQSTLDRQKRQAICRQIQELVLDECFTIPVAPTQRPWAYASYVKDFSYTLDDSPNVASIWLDK